MRDYQLDAISFDLKFLKEADRLLQADREQFVIRDGGKLHGMSCELWCNGMLTANLRAQEHAYHNARELGGDWQILTI